MSGFPELLKRARAAGALRLAFYCDLELAVDKAVENKEGLLTGPPGSWICHVVKDGRRIEDGTSGEDALRRVVHLLEEDRQHGPHKET